MTVLIAGGGIGGLALGIALRKAGMEPLVLERTPEFKPVGAGLVLSINALTVLARLGIAQEVLSAGAPLNEGQGRDLRGKLIQSTDFGELSRQFGSPAVAFHRAELHEVLARALGPDPVRLGAEVTKYETSSDGVSVTLSDGSTERGDVLVGADGLHSKIRTQLLGETPLRYAGQTTWRGISRGFAGVTPGVTCESWGPGRRFGFVPLKDERVYWFAVADAPAGGKDERPGIKNALLEAYRDWHAPITSILEATPEDAILRTDLFDRDPVRCWSEHRVTLLGDAAHPMTPNLGQGAGQAIEDALVLASALRTESSTDAAFRKYEAMRQPRTESIVITSRRFGQVAHWRNPIARAIRNAAMRSIPKGMVAKQLKDLLSVPELSDESRTPLMK